MSVEFAGTTPIEVDFPVDMKAECLWTSCETHRLGTLGNDSIDRRHDTIKVELMEIRGFQQLLECM